MAPTPQDLSFDYFEPFDCPERPQWLIDLAKKYDAELDPLGGPFQSVIFDDVETPGYTISIAGSQTGKSRALLMLSIIMATGKIPISMQYPKGMDTGIPRLVTKENITRFGQRKDGSCGNVIGTGIFPKSMIPPRHTGAEIWISSLKEVQEKMWKKRLQLMIPQGSLTSTSGRISGWNDKTKTFSFKTGTTIRLNTYEQEYRKMEGDMAWMVILDEEPPVRDYFLSAIEHCKYLRICFTPINGLWWSFEDCYLPIIKGDNKLGKIYSCTQYDSPFQSREKIDAKLPSYKLYEVKSRVFGQYTELSGKPYYQYEITTRYLKDYLPRHKLATILPVEPVDDARHATEVDMRLEYVAEPGDNVWEVYEKHNPTYSYWMSVDVGAGNEDPEKAQNPSCAIVRRLPVETEKDPELVAVLHSRMRNVEFAWLCLYGACYYNNCLIAPETGVSADGAVFVTSLDNYPYWYRHVNLNTKTYQLQTKIGFDTKETNRKYAFDLVGTWLYEHLEHSKIYHRKLLEEISECIIGKGGRPDHPVGKNNDCLMAFAISEYVYDVARQQIRSNRNALAKETAEHEHALLPNIFMFRAKPSETRPVIGSSRGMDARFGVGRPMTATR